MVKIMYYKHVVYNNL